MIGVADFVNAGYTILRHENGINYNKNKSVAIAEVDGEVTASSPVFKVKNVGKLINSVIIPSEDEETLHAWGHTLFATYLAEKQTSGAGGGAHDDSTAPAGSGGGGEHDGSTGVSSTDGMRLVQDMDSVDARFSNIIDLAEFDEYDANTGKPLVKGASSFIVQGSTETSKQRMAVEQHIMAIDQEDGEYSSIIASVENGALIEDENSGLQSAFWNHFDEQNYCILTRNMTGDGPNGVGFGLEVYKGDLSKAEVEVTLPGLETEGGHVTAPKVTVEGKESKREDGTTLAYPSWERGGPLHPGHAEFDKHKQGKNILGINVNSGHIWVDALYYHNQILDGPLRFEKVLKKDKGVEFPIETKVHLQFNEDEKDWFWWTTSPLPKNVPPWKPGTPEDGIYVPPTDDPDGFYGLPLGSDPTATGNAKPPSSGVRPITSEKDKRVRDKLKLAELLQAFHQEHNDVILMRQNHIIPDPIADLGLLASAKPAEMRAEVGVGLRSISLNASMPNIYDGQLGYRSDDVNAKEHYEFRRIMTPAAGSIEILGKVIDFATEYYVYDYVHEPENYAYAGGVVDGMAYVCPPGKRPWRGEDAVLSEFAWGFEESVAVGWLKAPDKNAGLHNIDSVYFKPYDDGLGKMDLEMVSEDAAGVRVCQSILKVCNLKVAGVIGGHWSRDAANTALYPTNAGDDIWLPDDKSVLFGNTHVAPDAYITWNNANSRLSIIANQVHKQQTYTDDGLNHYLNLKQFTRDSTAGIVAEVTYGDFVQGNTTGANNITGAVYANRTQVTNVATGTVTLLGGTYYIVDNNTSGATAFGIAATGVIQQKSTGYINHSYNFYARTFSYGTRATTIYDSVGFRDHANVYSTGDISVHKAFEAVAPAVTSTGKIQTYYGLYVAAIATPINKYPIYVVDQANESYLGGHYRIPDDRELRLGDAAGGDAQVSYNNAANQLILNTTTANCDILLDAVRHTRLNDDKQLVFGTGGDSHIRYISAADQLEIGTATADSDIILKAQRRTRLPDAKILAFGDFTGPAAADLTEYRMYYNDASSTMYQMLMKGDGTGIWKLQIHTAAPALLTRIEVSPILTEFTDVLSHSRIKMVPSETVMNDDNANIDFRVYGDLSTSLLMCDAGNDRVGVLTPTPLSDFDVAGTTGLGDQTGGDYTAIAADGSLTLVGDARKFQHTWISAAGFGKNPAKTPAWAKHGAGGSWEFQDGIDQEVVCNMMIPVDADRDEDMTLCIGWSTAPTALDCSWAIEYLFTSVNESVLGATAGDQSYEESSETANGLNRSDFTIAAAGISDNDLCVHLTIRRDATDILDTIGASVFFDGVALKYVKKNMGEDLP